eukprot:3408336-Lingulodinium_polyedra.AAC.1
MYNDITLVLNSDQHGGVLASPLEMVSQGLVLDYVRAACLEGAHLEHCRASHAGRSSGSP